MKSRIITVQQSGMRSLYEKLRFMFENFVHLLFYEQKSKTMANSPRSVFLRIVKNTEKLQMFAFV